MPEFYKDPLDTEKPTEQEPLDAASESRVAPADDPLLQTRHDAYGQPPAGLPELAAAATRSVLSLDGRTVLDLAASDPFGRLVRADLSRRSTRWPGARLEQSDKPADAATADRGIVGAPPETVTAELGIAGAPPETVTAELGIAGAPPETVTAELGIAGAPPETVTANRGIAGAPPEVSYVAADGSPRDLSDPTISSEPVIALNPRADGKLQADYFESADAARAGDDPLFSELTSYANSDGRYQETREVFRPGAAAPEKTTEVSIDSATNEIGVRAVEGSVEQTMRFSSTGSALQYEERDGTNVLTFELNEGRVVGASVNGTKVEGVEAKELIDQANLRLELVRQTERIPALKAEAESAIPGPTGPLDSSALAGSGTLVYEQDEVLKQAKVESGLVKDGDGKTIGEVHANGTVKLGQRTFNIGQSEGFAFHGVTADGARLDLASAKTAEKGLNGQLFSQDGRDSMSVIAGNMFKQNGELVGHLDDNGIVRLVGGDRTAVNNAFDRWTFAGEQSGKHREFFTGADTVSGTMFMHEANGGVQTKFDVKMGMLIDSTTGEQKGVIHPPSLLPDGRMSGGTVTFADKDGATKTLPFSALKNASFELKTMGATGGDEDIDQRTMRGLCLGGGRMADGQDNPQSGIFNVTEAMTIEARRERLSEKNAAGFKADHAAAMAYADDAYVVESEGKRLAARLQSEGDRTRYAHQNMKMMMGMINTGVITDDAVRSLRQRSDVSRSELASNPLEFQRQRLDSRPPVLDELPADVTTISGKVIVPAGGGKVETWSITKGEIVGPDGQPKGRIASNDGRLVRFDEQGQPVDSSMRAMAGAVWNLSFSDSSGSVKRPTLISLGEGQGLVSATDLRQRAFDEHWYAYNANETAGGSEESRKTYAEAGANRDRFEHRLNEIIRSGIRSADDVQFLSKGASDVRPAALRQELDAPPERIQLTAITDENVRHVNGKLRIGNDVYDIRAGDLYRKGEAGSSSSDDDNSPVGRLHPGYQVELVPGKVTSLASQNRVLMEFSLDDSGVHRVLGTGPAKIGTSGFSSGGLVDVDELMRQGTQHLREALNGNKEYFEKRPSLTGGFASWAMGGRDEALRDFAGAVRRDVGRLDITTTALFRTGFDTAVVDNSKLDFVITGAQATLRTIGSQASSTQMLAKEGTNLQHQINDGVFIAATTIATAGIGTGFALLANSSKVVQLGRMGQVLMFAGEAASSSLAGGILSTGIRADGSSSHWNNFKSGAVQGLATGAMGGANRWLTGSATMAQTGKVVARLEQGLPLSKDQVAILSSVTGRLYSKGYTNLARVTATTGDVTSDVVHAVAYAQADRIRNPDSREVTGQELGLMMLTSRLSHLAGMPLRDATKSDLLNAVSSSTINSFSRGAMQEIPRAFQADDVRIAKSLGLPFSLLSSEMLARNRDWSAIIAQAGEAGLTSAAMTPLLSSASFGVGRSMRSLLQPRPPARLPDLLTATDKPSSKAVSQSNTYSDRDEIADHIQDGFQQAGARTKFGEDGGFNRPGKENYAATTVDRANDPVLREVIAEAKHRFSTLPEKERADAVARYAHDLLAGSDIPGSERTRSNNTERWQAQFRQDNADKRILLGEYIRRGRGVCAEQTLLTKVLADELGLDATLVRGDKSGGNDLNHSWVKFKFAEGEPKIYDPRNQRYGIDAGRGYREGSKMENPNPDAYEASGTSGLGPINRNDPLRVSGLGAVKWEGTKYELKDRTGKVLTRNGQPIFRNDDDAWVSPNKEVAVALDGLGGHFGSDVASRIARERLASNWSKFPQGGGEDDTRRWLKNTLQEASDEIIRVRALAKDAERQGTHYVYGTRSDGSEMIAGSNMGTTVVATARHGDKLLIASAGDSRVFRLRAGRLEQLTADDTTPGAAGNIINNLLGTATTQIRETTVEIRPGDRLLVATDGLETLDRESIRRILIKPGSAEATSEALVDAVKAKGKPHQDNVTAIVFDIGAPLQSKPSTPKGTGPSAPVQFSSSMFLNKDDVILFGRKENIETDNRLVSREQFYLRRDDDGQCYIRDGQGKHNETYLNGFPVGNKWVPIYPEDELSVGAPVGGKLKLYGQEYDAIKLDLKVSERQSPAATPQASGAPQRLRVSEIVASWQNGSADGLASLQKILVNRPAAGQENIINSAESKLGKTPELRRQFLLATVQNDGYSIEARRSAALHLAVYAPNDADSIKLLTKLSHDADPILSALAASASNPQFHSGGMTASQRALALENAGLALAAAGHGTDVGARFRVAADRIRALPVKRVKK